MQARRWWERRVRSLWGVFVEQTMCVFFYNIGYKGEHVYVTLLSSYTYVGIMLLCVDFLLKLSMYTENESARRKRKQKSQKLVKIKLKSNIFVIVFVCAVLEKEMVNEKIYFK